MHTHRFFTPTSLALTVGLATVPSHGSPVFQPYLDFSLPLPELTLDDPYVVLPTAGDLNGDGMPDLISTRRDCTTLDVLLSIGRGAWAAPVAAATLPTGFEIYGLAPGDANGDGITDIAYWGSPRTDVSEFYGVFLGDGEGGFVSGPMTTDDLILDWSRELRFDTTAVGDVNGDGFADLVIANQSLVVLAGDGAGGLGAPEWISWYAFAVELIDLDGDGVKEIVTGEHGSLLVYRHNAGAWEEAGRALLDPDEQILNIAAFPGEEGAGRVRVACGLSDSALGIGTLTGSFGVSVTEPSTAPKKEEGRIVVADLLGGPEPEIIHPGGYYYLDQGDDRPQGPVSFRVSSLSTIAAADYDLDGVVDLLFGEENALGFARIVDTPSGRAFATPESAESPDRTSGNDAIGLTSGDFDGDGRRDVAVINLQNHTASVHYQEADGTFASVEVPDRARCARPNAADLDGDGRSDLVLPTRSGNVQLSFGEVDRSFGPATTIPFSSAANDTVITDADGDGLPDIIAQTDAGFAVARQTSPRVFEAGAAVAAPASRLGIDAGDLNGDGHPDVVFGADGETAPGTVFYTSLSNGDGTFADPVPAQGPHVLCESLVLADIDADGDLDLALASGVRVAGHPKMFVFENDGTGAFTLRQELQPSPSPGLLYGSGYQSVRSADINSDGLPDLAFTTISGQAELFFATGSGDGHRLINAGFIPSVLRDVNQIELADITGDGRPEILFPTVTPGGFEPDLIGFRMYRNLATPSVTCPADFDVPLGVLDLADIIAFVSAFSDQEAAADLAAPFAVFDLADITAFVDAFGAGCK